MITCRECKLEKDIVDYYIRSNGKLNSPDCKSCFLLKSKNKNLLNNETINENRRKNYLKKKETINENRRDNYSENKERITEEIKRYYEKNKDFINEKRRDKYNVDKLSLKYYYNNKESQNKKSLERKIKKLNNDPFYKLIHNIRCLVRISFKNQFTIKSKRTIEILGCSFEDFKLYLESKFDENMNWDNQGSYWHMDHIIPISSAESKEDVYRLNHYTNFQPLYWEDNLKKGNKLPST
jgi:hypothetical protein